MINQLQRSMIQILSYQILVNQFSKHNMIQINKTLKKIENVDKQIPNLGQSKRVIITEKLQTLKQILNICDLVTNAELDTKAEKIQNKILSITSLVITAALNTGPTESKNEILDITAVLIVIQKTFLHQK